MSLIQLDQKWYSPDNWVPHCTLALTQEDEDSVFYKASNLLLHEFKKNQWRI